MRKLMAFALMLISSAMCFSQTQTIQDPYSGLTMILSADNEYLTITGIKTGSPADLIPLRLGDEISKVNDRKVSEIENLNDFFKTSAEKWLNLLVKRIGSETELLYKLPRVSIDLFNNNFISEAELYQVIEPFQLRIFDKDISTEAETYNNIETIFTSLDNPDAYYQKKINNGAFCWYYPKKNVKNHTQTSILNDESKDMLKYRTFDFDYTSKEEPLIEKSLLNNLEKQLNRLGLKRNTENPDLLIIISFYSGKQEQYVPPQQITSTRIQDYFNWYWGYIPVPVTESKTKEGYTNTTYLNNINLKFLDASEITTSKVPPVVWSGSYSTLSSQQVFLTDMAENVFSTFLLQYPYVMKQNCNKLDANTYTYMGIIYDKNNPKIIADVIPGSPADKTGITKGDEIININGRKLNESLSPDNCYANFKNRSDYINAFKYIFLNSDFNGGDPRLFNPINWDYEDFHNFSGKQIEINIKRNGKKVPLLVTPEFRKLILFDDIGFTVE